MPRSKASKKLISYDFGRLRIAKTSITKPTTINNGERIILRELNNSSLYTCGSSEPPPVIRMNPRIINANPIPKRM